MHVQTIISVNFPGAASQTEVTLDVYASIDCYVPVAEFVAERIPGARVVIIGSPPVPILMQAMAWLEEACEQQSLTVLDRRDNVDDNAAGEQPLVQDLLTKYPDLDAVLCYNDQSALGAAAALTASQKPVWKEGESEGVIVGGVSGSEEGNNAVRTRRVTCSIDPNFDLHGTAAIAALSLVLTDGEPMEAMPKQVIVPSTMFEADNVDSWVNPLSRQETVADGLPLVKDSRARAGESRSPIDTSAHADRVPATGFGSLGQ